MRMKRLGAVARERAPQPLNAYVKRGFGGAAPEKKIENLSQYMLLVVLGYLFNFLGRGCKKTSYNQIDRKKKRQNIPILMIIGMRRIEYVSYKYLEAFEL